MPHTGRWGVVRFRGLNSVDWEWQAIPAEHHARFIQMSDGAVSLGAASAWECCWCECAENTACCSVPSSGLTPRQAYRAENPDLPHEGEHWFQEGKPWRCRCGATEPDFPAAAAAAAVVINGDQKAKS